MLRRSIGTGLCPYQWSAKQRPWNPTFFCCGAVCGAGRNASSISHIHLCRAARGLRI